jgi:hypothetical protein
MALANALHSSSKMLLPLPLPEPLPLPSKAFLPPFFRPVIIVHKKTRFSGTLGIIVGVHATCYACFLDKHSN